MPARAPSTRERCCSLRRLALWPSSRCSCLALMRRTFALGITGGRTLCRTPRPGSAVSRATLIVLPKWDTAPDRQKTGWVRVSGLLPASDPARTLYPAAPFGITREKTQGESLRVVDPAAAPPDLRFVAPRIVQTVSSKKL